MKKYIVVYIVAFISQFIDAKAQTKEPYNDKQNIAVVTEQEPFYPKGDWELYKYVLNLFAIVNQHVFHPIISCNHSDYIKI